MTASSDKTVRIVPLGIQDVLAIARTRVTRALTCDEWLTNVRDPNFCPTDTVTQNANALPTLAPITQVAVVSPTETVLVPAAPTEAPPATLESSPTTPPTPAPYEPTALPTATTASNPATPTLPIVATVRPVTPTPAVAPGVYITRIVYVPLDAPNFQFKVTFLNTTGAPVTYAKWVVPFFEPAQKFARRAKRRHSNHSCRHVRTLDRTVESGRGTVFALYGKTRFARQ